MKAIPIIAIWFATAAATIFGDLDTGSVLAVFLLATGATVFIASEKGKIND